MTTEGYQQQAILEPTTFANSSRKTVVTINTDNITNRASTNIHGTPVSMDGLIHRITEFLNTTDSYRILLIIIGKPGSGKTTISQQIETMLNLKFNEIGKVIPSASTNDGTNENIMKKMIDSSIVDLPSYSEHAMNSMKPDDELFPSLVQENETDHSIEVIGRGLDSTKIQITPNNTATTIESNDNSQKHEFAKRIPMDGFHLPLSTLSRFPDPDQALRTRGSPESFDSFQIVKLIQLLENTCSLPKPKANNGMLPPSPFWVTPNVPIPTITLPDFSHELKDPTPNGIIVKPETRVVIMEGLYLLLRDLRPWNIIPNGIPATATERQKNLIVCKVNVPTDICRSRVSKRHLESGLVNNLNEGVDRFNGNDLVNGKLVDSSSYDELIDLVINNYD